MEFNPGEYKTSIKDIYRFDPEPIGSGNFGTVFRVVNNIGRAYACKVFNPSILRDPQSFVAYLAESKIGTICNHDNLVAVHQQDYLKHVATGEKVPFILMDFVDGLDLDRFARLTRSLKREPVPWKFVALILAHVSAGLNVLHASGIVHGDIKEHNILLPKDSLPKLTDYGISHLLSDPRTAKAAGALSRSVPGSAKTDGMIQGTVCYIAPEQITRADEAPAEMQFKSDIYGLGIVALKTSHGLPAFLQNVQPDVVLVNTVTRNADLIAFVDGIPLNQAFRDLIRSCIHLDPNRRPTANVLQTQLLQVIYGDKKDITMQDIYVVFQQLIEANRGADAQAMQRALSKIEELDQLISQVGTNA